MQLIHVECLGNSLVSQNFEQTSETKSSKPYIELLALVRLNNSLSVFPPLQNLVTHFQRALKKPEALTEFRTISQMFRDGMYNPAPYYEHCKVALGDRFAEIFPELVALLPNITKQQVG